MFLKFPKSFVSSDTKVPDVTGGLVLGHIYNVSKMRAGNYKSQERMALDLGLSTFTIKKHLKAFKASGLVEVIKSGTHWDKYKLTEKGEALLEDFYPIDYEWLTTLKLSVVELIVLADIYDTYNTNKRYLDGVKQVKAKNFSTKGLAEGLGFHKYRIAKALRTLRGLGVLTADCYKGRYAYREVYINLDFFRDGFVEYMNNYIEELEVMNTEEFNKEEQTKGSKINLLSTTVWKSVLRRIKVLNSCSSHYYNRGQEYRSEKMRLKKAIRWYNAMLSLYDKPILNRLSELFDCYFDEKYFGERMKEYIYVG